MGSAIATIAPIFLVIVVGFFAKKYSFINDTAVKINNRLVFYIFLPALLVYKIADSKIAQLFQPNMIIVLYLSVFLIFLLSLAISVSLKVDKKDAGVVAISSFRGNFAYMGLPIAYYLFSNKGIVIGSMLIAFIVPFVNILSIFSLSVSSSSGYKKIIKDTFLTPIVIASFIGIFLSIYNIKIPQVLEKFLQILSLPALTLALVGIGASLEFKTIYGKSFLIVLSSMLKLVALPAVGLVLLKFFPLNKIQSDVLLVMLAAPPATLNYIMAQQMGGNEVLASANICLSTVFSFVTYAFWIYFMR